MSASTATDLFANGVTAVCHTNGSVAATVVPPQQSPVKLATVSPQAVSGGAVVPPVAPLERCVASSASVAMLETSAPPVNDGSQLDTATPAVNSQLTPTPAVNNQLTPTPAVNNQLTPTPAVNSQLTPTPAVNNQLTQTPAVNNQLTPTPAVNNQLTPTPAVNNQLTPTPAVNNQLTPTPAVNNQLTLTPAVNNQLTPTPAVISQSTPPPTAVDNQLTTAPAVIGAQQQQQSDTSNTTGCEVGMTSTSSTINLSPDVAATVVGVESVSDNLTVSAGADSGLSPLESGSVASQGKSAPDHLVSKSDGVNGEVAAGNASPQAVKHSASNSLKQDQTADISPSVPTGGVSFEAAEDDIAPSETGKGDVVPSEAGKADMIPSERGKADIVTPDAAKIDIVPSDSGKVQPESAKADPISSESAKVDVVSSESAKADVVSSESAKVDVVSSDSAKADIISSDSAKADIFSSDSDKADTVAPESDVLESSSTAEADSQLVASGSQPDPTATVSTHSPEAPAGKQSRAAGKRQLPNADTTTEITSKKPKLPVAEKTPRQTQRRKPVVKGAQSAGAVTTQSDTETTPVSAESSRPRRARAPTQPFQSTPLFTPTASSPASCSLASVDAKQTPADSKLVVFFKNEFMAVLNEEKSFYVCRAMQNVTKSSRKIKVRWMTCSGRKYTPDFYDVIDFESILTSLTLSKLAGGNKFEISIEELNRTKQILQRALNADRAAADVSISDQNHPDGLDISLYNDESQLDQLALNRSSESVKSRRSMSDTDSAVADSPQVAKKSHRLKNTTTTPVAAGAVSRGVTPRKSTARAANRQRRSSGKRLPVSTAAAVSDTSPAKTRAPVTAAASTARSPGKKAGKARTVASEKAAKQKVLAQAFARGKRANAGRGRKSPSSAASSDTGKKQTASTPVTGTRSSPRRRSTN